MFSRKESSLPTPSGVHNVLSQGTSLNGNLTTQDDIRIDGIIEGNIKSEGKIIIGAGGHVLGDIECLHLDIMGRVTGNIKCSDTTVFRSSAIYVGDLSTQILEVEPGAKITGFCKMNDQ